MRSAPATTGADAVDWWPLTAWWAAGGLAPVPPAAVARPGSTAEVSDILALCASSRVPVTPAAGRSGVCGAAVPVHGGVVLDLCGIAGLREVRSDDLLVDVGPGTWGDQLEAELRAEHDLTIGHWPQSMSISTVGGWAACRGAGQYSTRYGKVEDLVAGLEVVLADGRVIRTGGRAPRSAVGPDLTALFVGSEGTLGVITEVTLRARPVPTAQQAASWGLESFQQGLEACRRILRRGATPAVLRLYDPAESARHFSTPEGTAVLIVIDEAEERLVEATTALVREECAALGATALGGDLAERWLEHRNEVPSLAGLAAAGIVADTVEVAAGWSALPGIYAEAVAAVAALGPTLAVTAHQSHAYRDGACIYFSFAGQVGEPGAASGRLDRATVAAGEAYYRAAWDAVVDATLERGGTLSHHHGVGINRGRYVGRALGAGQEILAALKSSLDPHGILNPGKLGLDSPWGPPPWP